MYLWFIGTLVWYGGRAAIREWKTPDLPGPAVAISALVAILVVGIVYYMNEEQVGQLLWTTAGLIPASFRNPTYNNDIKDEES